MKLGDLYSESVDSYTETYITSVAIQVCILKMIIFPLWNVRLFSLSLSYKLNFKSQKVKSKVVDGFPFNNNVK